VIETAYVQIITILYKYFCIWGLDLRLNNINYSYWYYLSSIITISLYWTSKPLSSYLSFKYYNQWVAHFVTVREIGFLGVVIRLDGIKMEEEKIREVLVL